jgi:hypothetical protein
MSFGFDYLHLRGTVIPRPQRAEDAEEFAYHAANHRSTWTNIALNIFSDASRYHIDDTGGYAVTFHKCTQPRGRG